MVIKIALAGPAGSGKDTIAQAFITRSGGRACRLGFADPIKEVAANVLGIGVDDVNAIKEGRDGEEHKYKMRVLLQKIGTEVFREYDTDVWVNALLRRAMHNVESNFYEYIIVTDMRFPNEASALESKNFLLVDVQCLPEHMRCKPGTSEYNHSSERALDQWRKDGRFHLTVMNDRKVPLDSILDTITKACVARDVRREEARKIPAK